MNKANVGLGAALAAGGLAAWLLSVGAGGDLEDAMRGLGQVFAAMGLIVIAMGLLQRG